MRTAVWGLLASTVALLSVGCGASKQSGTVTATNSATETVCYVPEDSSLTPTCPPVAFPSQLRGVDAGDCIQLEPDLYGTVRVEALDRTCEVPLRWRNAVRLFIQDSATAP